ncbi:MAG: SDR family oxidoreductase [Caulobacterales bacterium]|nr:SDR family oxidoreductase [Caulobacterales bacterium]
MSTVLITGANRGIGLGHVRRFSERGWRVRACCRRPDAAEALQALAREHPDTSVHAYDAADIGAPAQLAADIGEAPIDLLFANAGVMTPMDRAGLTDAADEEFMHVMRINVLAPLALASALIDRVAASERRIFAAQSSGLGSIAGAESGGAYAYRASKAALNMVVKTLAADTAARGVIAVALAPGWVRTDMGGAGAPLTVDDSVAAQQSVLDALTPSDTGRFLDRHGADIAW